MRAKQTLLRPSAALLVAVSLSGALSGCGVLIAGAAGAAAGYVAGTLASDDDGGN